jgi:hypothetical protein
MNGVKVGNNMIGLSWDSSATIYVTLHLRGIAPDNLSYDYFFIIIPVTLPVMLPELYNEYYLNTIGLGQRVLD